MSAVNMSPSMNVALSRHARFLARSARDSATMSGLNSTPTARAPRLAAAMMLRPSPEPRSITKSCGVTCRHVEHLLDELRRRRHPHDVFAGLTDGGLERLLWLRGLCGGTERDGSASDAQTGDEYRRSRKDGDDVFHHAPTSDGSYASTGRSARSASAVLMPLRRA